MAWPRSFAAFLAMGICVIASIKFDNPLNCPGTSSHAAHCRGQEQDGVAGGSGAAARTVPVPAGQAAQDAQQRRQARY
jgi:hypothetical protein